MRVPEVIPANLIDRITGTPTLQWALVTRQDAIAWLDHNDRNRNLSPRAVAKYESDMRDGLWGPSSATIAFDTDGRLIDGQHRLTALARIGDTALIMAVITGLPTDAQRRIDRGRARTHGEQLIMDGIGNGNFVSSSARFRIRWERGNLFTGVHGDISDAHLDVWLEANPGHRKTVEDLYTPCRRIQAPPRVSLALAGRLREIDSDKADEFIRDIADGGLKIGDPTHTLRERFFRAKATRENIDERDALGWMIQAWNARRENRLVSKYQRPRGNEWTKETFPVPK
jgi:hypothetical protein